jgi:hypothetical protein
MECIWCRQHFAANKRSSPAGQLGINNRVTHRTVLRAPPRGGADFLPTGLFLAMNHLAPFCTHTLDRQVTTMHHAGWVDLCSLSKTQSHSSSWRLTRLFTASERKNIQ